MKTNKVREFIQNAQRTLLTKFLFLVPLLVGLLACADASALMIPLTTTALVDRATCIVEGRVANLSSRWTDDHSAIITEVMIDVTDILLGDTNRVTFFYKGGIVGELEQRVSDVPVVTNGQQVLVFLRAPTPEEGRCDRTVAAQGVRYTLVGAAQGLHRIEGARAIKDGFTVVGNPALIDRNEDVIVLKARIRERLGASRREGGAR